MSKPIDKLSQEEMDALEAFAQKYGYQRLWKVALNNLWLNGRDANEPGGHLLRRIRNRLGPRWLMRLPADPSKW